MTVRTVFLLVALRLKYLLAQGSELGWVGLQRALGVKNTENPFSSITFLERMVKRMR